MPTETPLVPHHERLSSSLAGRDVLSLRDLRRDEILEVFDRAFSMKADPLKFSTALRGRTLALIFQKPSLRTRVSFDVGMHQLGGHALDLSADVSLGSREALYDVAKNLERMVDGVVLRTFGHDTLERLAAYASVPVINALSDFSHPCQGLADFMTMLEVKGRIEGLRVAYVGDGNNVAHSLLFGAALLGAHVTIACPPSFDPRLEVLTWCWTASPAMGGSCRVVHDPRAAVRDVDVVYTDVWASMGQEEEAETRRAIFRPYQVNAGLMALADPDAIFMHCLPAHRGDEVTDEVIDSPQSVVFQQAENRLHVQKALLFGVLR